VVIFALSGQLAALCIALSAGILASTFQRQFIQAAVWGVLYCLALNLAVFGVHLFAWRIVLSTSLRPFVTIISPLLTVSGAVMILVLVLRFAGRNLKARWQRENTDFKPPRWIRRMARTSLWRAILAWDTRKARSAHPIAWLQEYSWSARLAKWGWCILALAGELFVVMAGVASNKDRGAQVTLAAVVALGIALSGANSFRTERLTGAMELLLVAPLSPLKLIGGRLWGIWVHFFPAVAIIGFTWLSGATLFGARRADASLLIAAYLFLPMIGLYVSMFPWNVLIAWLAIYVVGAVMPFLIGTAFRYDFGVDHHVVITVAIQAALGLTACGLLVRKLKSRNFVFQNGRE
jgi:hypothetical protein